ncbi:MAG TPA: hypothetical protein VF396_23915 [Bradyrhizobium sp.]
MRHAPQDRIVRREIAEDVIKAAEGFEGALAVRVEDKRQGPPKLHDLPSVAFGGDRIVHHIFKACQT